MILSTNHFFETVPCFLTYCQNDAFLCVLDSDFIEFRNGVSFSLIGKPFSEVLILAIFCNECEVERKYCK